MCPPSDRFHDVDGDEYSGHKIVAEAFSRYITLTPRLHCHPFRYPVPSLPPPEPLDVFIAHSIHLCEVPEIVPYAAFYLLISISQPCQCRTPHEDDNFEYILSSPSKFSHILSRAVTRTPFFRFRWSDRHVFVGAFYLALAIYKDILSKDQGKELPCWGKLPLLFGICEGEIMKVTAELNPYITPELQMAIKSMMQDDYVRDIVEIDCPFVLARRKRLSEAKDAKGKNQKGKSSSKGSAELAEKLERKPICAF